MLGPPGLYGLEVSVEQRQPIEDGAQNGRSVRRAALYRAPRCRGGAQGENTCALFTTRMCTSEEKSGLKENLQSCSEINRQTFVLERVYAKTLRTIGASSAPLFTRRS